MRFLIIFFLVFSVLSKAQEIKIPSNITNSHPRLITKAATGKKELKRLMEAEQWAKETFNKSKEYIDPYVNRHQSDPQWIVSRLQMYWKTKSTDVYVKGPVYSHATGEAPVPTVRFTGSRDAVTIYAAPKLEDITPYMDDPRGLLLHNTTKPGRPLEWAEQSKSGVIIQSINRNIVSMAQTAAFFYWYTGEEKYAKFAYDIFDTYMYGMYYRKEPVDISHSHIQTLVGLSSFEVIHEDILDELTLCYDFLHPYLNAKGPAKMNIYADTFKKWADLIVKNGVPFNNWDLIEARFVSQVALILENDKQYADGKGAQFYLNQVLNRDVLRQWSLPKLIKYGFDPITGIWNESPGYSMMVVKEFLTLATLYDDVLNFDVLEQLPILKKAVLVMPEYLYPNGYTVAFGDSYYNHLSLDAAFMLVANAQKHNKKAQEEQFTRYIKTVEIINGVKSEVKKEKQSSRNFLQLFSAASVNLRSDIQAGQPQDFMSAAFNAPNSSYFVQRNGLSAKNGLMISQAGSKGNHAHANGIAMELIGKGVIMAPEAGIGTSYFQADYKEYYSQFVAHNTVVVDGISSYPEMRSNHGFEVKSSYPASQQKTGYFNGLTYSDLYFLEPETNADQRRLMSIIRIDSTAGYYVDIFRSAKKDGKDKRHDYFYHNIGQELIIADNAGKALALNPTDKLAFADGDMFGYDYIWDKKSVATSNDFTARFNLNYPGKGQLQMNMWMKGYPGREVFSVKTPIAKATTRGALPDTISHLPVPAVVVRQEGAAWNKPFAAVFEPVEEGNTSIKSIRSFNPITADSSFVGLIVENKKGSTDYIFSSATAAEASFRDFRVSANYALVREANNNPEFLFLGKGRELAYKQYSLKSANDATAALTVNNTQWTYVSDKPLQVTFSYRPSSNQETLTISNQAGQVFVAKKINDSQYLVELPASTLSTLTIK